MNNLKSARGALPRGIVFVVTTMAASAAVASTPSPTPTPRTRTLAEYAGRISLKTSGVADASGQIVISTETLSAIADGGTITIGGISVTGKARLPTPLAASPSERARWRAAHNKQTRVIVGLERRRALLEIEIHHIGDQSLTIKTMARLQRAEAKLRQLEDEISAERAELARIVRDARRDGAEPGWFR